MPRKQPSNTVTAVRKYAAKEFRERPTAEEKQLKIDRRIMAAQKSVEPCVPLAPFCRLVREITADVASRFQDLRYQKDAIEALRVAAEAFLVEVFVRCTYLAEYTKRVTVYPCNMRMVFKMQLDKNYLDFDDRVDKAVKARRDLRIQRLMARDDYMARERRALAPERDAVAERNKKGPPPKQGANPQPHSSDDEDDDAAPQPAVMPNDAAPQPAAMDDEDDDAAPQPAVMPNDAAPLQALDADDIDVLAEGIAQPLSHVSAELLAAAADAADVAAAIPFGVAAAAAAAADAFVAKAPVAADDESEDESEDDEEDESVLHKIAGSDDENKSDSDGDNSDRETEPDSDNEPLARIKKVKTITEIKKPRAADRMALSKAATEPAIQRGIKALKGLLVDAQELPPPAKKAPQRAAKRKAPAKTAQPAKRRK